MTRKRLAIVGVGALILAGSVALAKGKGILNPTFSNPTKGTYDAPAAELGKPPSKDMPWTTTTYSSSINNNPVKGKPVTVTGEIIDYSCYLQVGKHGDKHRDCGQKCVRQGQPAGLLAQDGTIYLLMDEEHNPRRDGETTMRQACVDHMAEVVKVNGTMTNVEGVKAIYVQGFLK